MERDGREPQTADNAGGAKKVKPISGKSLRHISHFSMGGANRARGGRGCRAWRLLKDSAADGQSAHPVHSQPSAAIGGLQHP
jgi:hypothetical protein